MKLPLAKLWAAYVELGSVHRVGKRFGVTGDTVHQHLKRAGYKLNNARWTVDELAALRSDYAKAEGCDVDPFMLALKLGRTYASVTLKASRLGLTDISHPKSAAAAVVQSERTREQWRRQPHPRGMAGKPQSERAKEAVARSSRARWERDKRDGVGLMSEEHRQRRSDQMSAAQAAGKLNRASRGAAGRRADLGGMFFRSSWEANYARYLTMLMHEGRVLKWEFEPDTFWFEKIRRGVRSYLPDFKVWPISGADAYYVEVKGWMDAKSATKLKRMAKYYPGVRIELVSKDAYKMIERRFSNVIPHWEKRKGDFEPCAAPEGGAIPPQPVEGLSAPPDWLAPEAPSGDGGGSGK